jgi:hypothetical protein
MVSALLHRRLERRGGFTITLVSQHRRGATAPGLAQVLGRPLRPGETAVLRGVVPAGTELMVQAMDGRRVVDSYFQLVGEWRGAASIHVSKGPHGYPRTILVLGGHRRSAQRVAIQQVPSRR